MYVNCSEKLQGFCHHLSNAVTDDGEVLLMVIHADHPHDADRLNVLAKYGNFLRPELAEGDHYEDFTPYEIICMPPYFRNEIKFEEFVVGSSTLRHALAEAGFVAVTSVNIETEQGAEDLHDFAVAFNLAIYKCTKK